MGKSVWASRPAVPPRGPAPGSDVAALDLFLELLDDLGDPLQFRIELKRPAIDLERLLVVADVLQDQPQPVSAPKWRGSRVSTWRILASERP